MGTSRGRGRGGIRSEGSISRVSLVARGRGHQHMIDRQEPRQTGGHDYSIEYPKHLTRSAAPAV